MSLGTVRPEQGPPLSIPLRFFAVGPVALVIAGALLAARGDDGVTSVWGSTNVALVHLAVVGLLLFTMVGALYQVLPVVAGAVVPWPRLPAVAHALLVLGAGSLLWGQATGSTPAFRAAVALVGSGLVLFLLPAALAIGRTRVPGATTWGIRVALGALLAVAYAGLRLAHGRSGAGYPGDWVALRWAHAHLGLVCWVGGLITSVSWQVLPMFYLVEAPPPVVRWSVLVGVLSSLLGLSSIIALDAPSTWVPWMAAPGALAIWLVHPAWVLWALQRRRRKRRDPSLWFWRLAAGSALLCPAAGAAAYALPWSRGPLLYGVLVLWGWAASTVMGMLARIIPFLAWFHRCAPRIGISSPPSMKELLTDQEVAMGFRLHVLALGAGLGAALGGGAGWWRAFGFTLALSGAFLGWAMVAILARSAPHAGPKGRVGPSPSTAQSLRLMP